jgi:hypothetical protein
MRYRTDLANFAGRSERRFRATSEINHRHVDESTNHLFLRTLKSLSGVKSADIDMMGDLAWRGQVGVVQGCRMLIEKIKISIYCHRENPLF